MDSLRNLEAMVASWYKSVPHLPKNGQRWLAENAWWLTLVGVILGTMGILSVLLGVLLAGTLLAGYGGPIGAAIGGLAFMIVIISLAFGIVDMILSAFAIAPLKAMQKRGWSLLFLVALINVLSLLVSFLFQLNLFSLIWGLLFAAVGGYFLFEVRDYFHTHRPAKKASTRAAKEA
ncbi:MAG TPA: hypothetical protein VFS14_03200 [Candidatus Saccharimonadales bacterium]|nr:hypothetical protein [Candidatus Saccharimonadales bacterium]